MARGSGYTMFLTGDELVLSLRKPAASESRTETHGPRITAETSSAEAHNTVVRMQLLGANPAPEVVGLGDLPGKSNYFVGNDPQKWRTDVPHYSAVEYRAVYPGINLVYYGNQRQLEYDLVISAGADPGDVRLGFQGVESLSLDDDGNLILHTAAGQIRRVQGIRYP